MAASVARFFARFGALTGLLAMGLAFSGLAAEKGESGKKPVGWIFAYAADNDLYRVLAAGGAACPRFASAGEAIPAAAEGSSVLLLADGYPDKPTEPLLFDHPRGNLLVATTELSHFVTGRYLPTEAETQALRRSADWIVTSRSLRHADWPRESLNLSLTYNTVRDMPRRTGRWATGRQVCWKATVPPSAATAASPCGTPCAKG